ncbi:MAG TPA: retropepsin-like aspartic protease [Chitinophagaceae bacterium]|nr:retropepsin-like aspartic protease [Chitinophagaceae bacterium]
MVLRFPLLFEGSKNSRQLYALFDSGATYSCVNGDIAEEFEIFTRLHTPLKLATASEHVFTEITNRITLDFYKEDIRMSDEFLVVPNLSEEVVIGAATMQKWRIKLDFENDTVIIDPKVAKLILINLIKKD